LRKGNLKRLDLDVFFRLSTPTAQRIYRFLDKRFYGSRSITMNLQEFACGHVGLTDAGNVAVLKRRLAPALAELEQIGFLAALPEHERYCKVRAGEWRIHLCPQAETKALAEANSAPVPLAVPATAPAAEIARDFYRLWNPAVAVSPGPRDLEHAEALLAAHGPEETRELLTYLIKVTRAGWPDCRSLSGAAQKYRNDAERLWKQDKAREATRRESERTRLEDRRSEESRRRAGQALQQAWDALPPTERASIEETVRARLGLGAPEAFVRRLCQEELSQRQGERGVLTA
jgi:hypothetical protein